MSGLRRTEGRRDRPHCLLLSFHFPPSRGSGVYRIRAWANHLVDHGWDVTVVTVDPRFYDDITGSPDWGLLSTVDDRVKLAHFKFPYEYLRQDVREMSWTHASLGPAYLRFWQSFPQRFFPEIYGHALPLMVARGLSVAARSKVDLVLATGNPYTQLGAASVLAQLLRVPYAVDFHDSWTLDQFAEKDAFPRSHPAWTWERRIVTGAARTITVNEPLAEWYREEYPAVADRVRVVENGWEPKTLPDPGPAVTSPERPLRLGYVGTIRSDLPLEAFVAGWKQARRAVELKHATFSFYGYLGFFRWNRTAVSHLLEDPAHGLHYRGPVSQLELSDTYSQLDGLAMLTPSSRYVTAGKVYDYMASGRPVLGVHDERNDSTTAFTGYPGFVPVDGVSPDAIAAGLVALARVARTSTAADHEQRRAVALEHTWDAAIAPVSHELLELVR